MAIYFHDRSTGQVMPLGASDSYPEEMKGIMTQYVTDRQNRDAIDDHIASNDARMLNGGQADPSKAGYNDVYYLTDAQKEHAATARDLIDKTLSGRVFHLDEHPTYRDDMPNTVAKDVERDNAMAKSTKGSKSSQLRAKRLASGTNQLVRAQETTLGFSNEALKRKADELEINAQRREAQAAQLEGK